MQALGIYTVHPITIIAHALPGSSAPPIGPGPCIGFECGHSMTRDNGGVFNGSIHRKLAHARRYSTAQKKLKYRTVGVVLVRSKYAEGTPEVRSRCGRGTLEVRSRYARGTLEVRSGVTFLGKSYSRD